MMNRRGFIIGALALGGCVPAIVTKPAKRIAVTMDDFNIGFGIRLNPRERNERILDALATHKHKAAGFVTGRMVDNVFGDEVVKSWSNARDYYVEAVLRLANHFQGLAGQVGYPNIPHAMLMHHNILNGLFLNDVLTALKADGWSLIDAKEAFEHPIYKLEPETPTRGRSLLSVLAQEQGIEDTNYPAAYMGWGEKKMDALRL